MKNLLTKQGLTLLTAALSLSLLAGCGSSQSDSGTEEKTAWDEIKEEGTLTVATSGTLFPTSFREEGTDELTGFEVEVVREIANRLELEVEFTELGFDEMLHPGTHVALHAIHPGMRAAFVGHPFGIHRAVTDLATERV